MRTASTEAAVSERWFIWGRPDCAEVPGRVDRAAPRPPRATPLPVRLVELLSASSARPETLAWPKPDRRDAGWKRTTVA